MSHVWQLEASALGQVALAALVLGAGLPALFALGVRALAGSGARDDAGNLKAGRRVLAWLAFGVVIATIVGAVAYIAAGGH